MHNDNNTLDTEVVVPFKYCGNFLRALDLPLINCEIELDLSWSKECIITKISIISRIPPNPGANPIPLFRKSQKYKQLVQHFK